MARFTVRGARGNQQFIKLLGGQDFPKLLRPTRMGDGINLGMGKFDTAAKTGDFVRRCFLASMRGSTNRRRLVPLWAKPALRSVWRECDLEHSFGCPPQQEAGDMFARQTGGLAAFLFIFPGGVSEDVHQAAAVGADDTFGTGGLE